MHAPSRHTVGPWSFDGHGINAAGGERIAKVCHKQYGDEGGANLPRFEADSRLIAAAPELLDALAFAYSLLTAQPCIVYDSEFARIKQAIELTGRKLD